MSQRSAKRSKGAFAGLIWVARKFEKYSNGRNFVSFEFRMA